MLGEETYATGTRAGRVRTIKFHKYLVEYPDENAIVTEETAVSKKGLQPGDTVEITYTKEEDGTMKIVSEATYKL